MKKIKGFTLVKSGKAGKPKTYLTGFTIIELLVVVAIIGVLATIVVINVKKNIAKSTYATTYADMTAIAKSVNLYTTEHNGVKPKEWSGYSNYTHSTDGVHTFYNSTNSSDSNYNDFFADKLNGERPVPPCQGSAYSYYKTSTYSYIIYWTPNSGGHSNVVLPVDGVMPSGFVNIKNKTEKSITCQETQDSDFL